MTTDFVQQFRDAIRNAGLTPPDAIKADGELHRFASNGKRGDLAGWYVLHADGIPAGSFGCWRAGITESWHADIGRSLTGAERELHLRRTESAKRQREQAERERHADAAERAAREWEAAKPASDSHPYLQRKGVRSHGVRQHRDGRLLIPLRDRAGVWQSLQYISADGDKLFLSGGKMAGGYFAIGKAGGTVCIAEGFATAATIHEATGLPVAVAFNAGNLEPVARALRDKLPTAKLILCADDDAATEGNPGMAKATEAARAVDGLLAVPDFGADRPAKATDFNDLAMHRGANAVRACIGKAMRPYGESWPDPLPLVADFKAEPYPLDALPGAIGDAVREVAAFVQCPVALAACSALSALSVAAQGLANVRRGPDLEGPVSLYLLAVAESGERKSACDRHFAGELSLWEADQAEQLKPDLAKSRAEMAAWDAEREAVLLNIKGARKEGKSTDKARAELERLEGGKPEAVRVPRLVLESETAESLAWNLARPDGWPSGGILSSEAGIIFGGHSMRRDTIMHSLALFNKLWSGETYKVSRKTGTPPIFELTGARLTMGLAVQPGTVQAFFDESKGLARDTGFAARFLIAWPESTQGTRLYRDAPKDWPGLTAFKAQLRRLLDTRLTIDAAGHLSPPPLDLDPQAFEGWRRFHDGAEQELRSGGELADVRDVASKAAENCARVAALFHLVENGPNGRIGAAHMAAAARIITWHLFEARRFLGGLALPKTLSNAAKLDAWLIAECCKRGTDSVTQRDALRLGPNPVRKKSELTAALVELAETCRARLDDDGRTVRVNPALLRV